MLIDTCKLYFPVVHEHGTLPDQEMNHFGLMPGTHTEGQVWVELRKRLEKPWGTCQYYREKVMTVSLH